jgi:hypothetical protein
MNDATESELAERIVQRGREVVAARLRSAFAHQAATRANGLDVDPEQLEQMVQEATRRAGHTLWRRSLAEAVMEELDLDLPAALAHPALAAAEGLIHVGVVAPLPFEAIPELEPAGPPASGLAEPQALRLSAVHLSGIESLRRGDRDLELRLSDAGLDVLKRSTEAAIGRLEWSEIESVELPAAKRGLRGRRRPRELHVSTGRGQARFELPGVTEEEIHEHLEPTLARLRRTGAAAASAATTPAGAD